MPQAGRRSGALTGDFATADDLVQEAILAALKRWPVEGVPERPSAWLFVVARNRALDTLRREANYRARLAQLEGLPPSRRRSPSADLHVLPPGVAA
jgi:predicted RNA polymerase sigma factor